jgi:glycosyltransferase involved in cell wall biosynthesis
MTTILQILPSLESGGVERGAVEIDNAIVENGWASIVVSAGGRMQSQLKGKHLRLPVNSKNPFKILFHIWVLRLIIKVNEVNLVHARSRAPAWSAWLAAKWCGVPFVTTFHGTYGTKGALKRWYNAVMLKGKKVIAVSHFIKKHILENYKADADKIIVIHRGVDLEKFAPETTKTPLGLTPGKKIVMLPGRVSRWKGQDIFIEAMKDINAYGVIVGDVESADYMKELEQIMTDNIITLPGTSEIAAVMANADVIVSASTKPEAFGRIAIEAQSLGKPVVATNIGGSLETVIEGRTGYLVPPKDPMAMRHAIKQILESEQDWKSECIENASQFTRENMCRKTLEVYTTLLTSSPSSKN